jgi:hypothetical protein
MRDAMRWLGLGALLGLGVVACGDGTNARADAGGLGSGSGDAAPRGPGLSNRGDAAAPEAGSDGNACRPLTSAAAALGPYVKAWNTPEVKARDCLLAQSVIADAIYVDSTFDARNRDALSKVIGTFFTISPMAGIDATSQPLLREKDLRFTWDLRNGGAAVASGTDYIQLDPSGQLAAIHGFFEPFNDDKSAIATVTAYVDAWSATGDTARDAALADAVAGTVRFLDTKQDLRGSTALADAMRQAHAGGLSRATSMKLQGYGTPPTHARVQLELQNSAGTSTVTDYLRFDAAGHIEHIGRFVEP